MTINFLREQVTTCAKSECHLYNNSHQHQ